MSPSLGQIILVGSLSDTVPLLALPLWNRLESPGSTSQDCSPFLTSFLAPASLFYNHGHYRQVVAPFGGI